MHGRMRLEERLRVAGLEDHGGLWRDPENVIGVAPTQAGAFVGWLDVTWSGPATPEWQLRDVVHLSEGQFEHGIVDAIHRARTLAEKRRRICRYCGGRFVPGHMHSKDVCQGCAERALGVVH